MRLQKSLFLAGLLIVQVIVAESVQAQFGDGQYDPASQQEYSRAHTLIHVDAPRLIKAGRLLEAEKLVDQAIAISRKVRIPGVGPVDVTSVASLFQEHGQTQTAVRILKSYADLVEQHGKTKNPALPEFYQRQFNAGFARTLRSVFESLALAQAELGQLSEAKASLAKAAAQKVPSLKEIMQQNTDNPALSSLGIDLSAIAELDDSDANSQTKRHAEILLAVRGGNRQRIEELKRQLDDYYRKKQGQQVAMLQQLIRSGKLKQTPLPEQLETAMKNPHAGNDFLIQNEFVEASLILGDDVAAGKFFDQLWKGSRGFEYLMSDKDREYALQASRVSQFQMLMQGPQQHKNYKLMMLPHAKELSLSLATFAKELELKELSMAWLANLKGNAHENHLAYNLVVARNIDGEVSRLLAELRKVNSEMASRTLAGIYDPTFEELMAQVNSPEGMAKLQGQWQKVITQAGNDPARFAAAMEEAERANESFGDRSQRLERELRERLNRRNNTTTKTVGGRVEFDDSEARQYDDLLIRFVGRPLLSAPWVSLEKIRETLAPGQFLVDIARFRYFDRSASSNQPLWKDHKYVAWIVPPKNDGEIQVIDLGLADRIDAAVDQSRRTLIRAIGAGGTPGTLADLGERESEKLLRKKSSVLAELVWKPLASSLKSAKSLVICPDSKLWLYPWEALPIDDDQFLVEQLPIRYIVSARDVITGTSDFETTAPVILANPSYDRGTPATHRSNKSPIRSGNTKSTSLLPKVSPLPATAAEAEAIVPGLQQYSGQEPLLLLEDQATETRLREINSPHTLVLATHGFVLDQDRVWDRRGFEDPMLRGGLLLSGCNVSAGQIDDGVLTALEALGLNLIGTRLVVLSACESALGDVSEGESVAGLRQAFLLAGAKAVVATTWSIPDVESARLMKGFFGNLAKGQTQQEALRSAQLTQIQMRRDKYGAAHPFFWAAYTLTGNDSASITRIEPGR